MVLLSQGVHGNINYTAKFLSVRSYTTTKKSQEAEEQLERRTSYSDSAVHIFNRALQIAPRSTKGKMVFKWDEKIDDFCIESFKEENMSQFLSEDVLDQLFYRLEQSELYKPFVKKTFLWCKIIWSENILIFLTIFRLAYLYSYYNRNSYFCNFCLFAARESSDMDAYM